MKFVTTLVFTLALIMGAFSGTAASAEEETTETYTISHPGAEYWDKQNTGRCVLRTNIENQSAYGRCIHRAGSMTVRYKPAIPYNATVDSVVFNGKEGTQPGKVITGADPAGFNTYYFTIRKMRTYRLYSIDVTYTVTQ